MSLKLAVVTMMVCAINLIGHDMVTLPEHVISFQFFFVRARVVRAFLLLLSRAGPGLLKDSPYSIS